MIFGRAQYTVFALSLFSSISTSRQHVHRKQCVKQSFCTTSRQQHGGKPLKETNHLWYLVSCYLHRCVENGRGKKRIFKRRKEKTYKIFFFRICYCIFMLSLVLPLTVLTWHCMFAVPFWATRNTLSHWMHEKWCSFVCSFLFVFFHYQPLVKDNTKCLI